MRVPKRHLLVGASTVLLYSFVATTALALFLPQAKLNNVELEVATLELLVSKEQIDNPTTFAQEVVFTGSDNLEPGGEVIQEDFWVMNTSGPGYPLSVTGQFTTGTQDWEALQDVIELNVVASQTGAETGWKSIKTWNSSPVTLPGGSLASGGSKRRYQMKYRVVATYPIDPDGTGPKTAGSAVGSELMGKKTGALQFVLDGVRE